ncbi:MAG TPA: hypothetical protein VFI43_03435, partial [Nitrosospira sp.]|nr:hypothetical protein [Nitrosospira sp.]
MRLSSNGDPGQAVGADGFFTPTFPFAASGNTPEHGISWADRHTLADDSGLTECVGRGVVLRTG